MLHVIPLHSDTPCLLQVLLAMVRRAAALLRSLVPELAPGAEPRPSLAADLQRQLRGEGPAGEILWMPPTSSE